MKSQTMIILGTVLFPNIILANNEEESDSKSKKNIILIALDDLRTELNCYGADYMYTPNFDKFASSGVIFNRAY